MPHQASREERIRVAENTLRTQGIGCLAGVRSLRTRPVSSRVCVIVLDVTAAADVGGPDPTIPVSGLISAVRIRVPPWWSLRERGWRRSQRGDDFLDVVVGPALWSVYDVPPDGASCALARVLRTAPLRLAPTLHRPRQRMDQHRLDDGAPVAPERNQRCQDDLVASIEDCTRRTGLRRPTPSGHNPGLCTPSSRAPHDHEGTPGSDGRPTTPPKPEIPAVSHSTAP